MPDRCRRRCRRLPRTLAAVRRPAVRARARLMAACAAMVIGLAASASPGPGRSGAERALSRHTAAVRAALAARAVAGAVEADLGLPAARLRLRRAAPLPGVLFQRRPGPVRLEPL